MELTNLNHISYHLYFYRILTYLCLGNTKYNNEEHKLTYLVAQKSLIREPQIPRSDDFDLGIRNAKYKKYNTE